MSHSNPAKRRLFDDDVEADSDGYGTPTKDSQPSDGHFSTPKKERMEYDFWSQGSCSSNMDLSVMSQNSQEVGPKQAVIIKITDLVEKEYFEDEIRFRVVYIKLRAGGALTFHGLDDSGEISLFAFRDFAIKFADILKIDKAVKLTNFKVVKENEKFPSGSGNNLEIKLSINSELSEISNELIPKIQFSFKGFEEIRQLGPKVRTDVLGIIVKDWGVENLRMGKMKRELSLTNKSKEMLTLVLWGYEAENFSSELFSTIAIRKGVTAEYQGRTSINCYAGTLVWVNPDVEQAKELKEWFDAVRK